MYQYTESGLNNVWLANGYQQRGDAIAIKNSDSLHQAIGRVLAHQAGLNGPEFRYLRKALGLSQTRLGSFLRVSEESVSLWERQGRIPLSAIRIVQAMYLEIIDGVARIGELVEVLAAMDCKPSERMVFSINPNGSWLESAEPIEMALAA